MLVTCRQMREAEEQAFAAGTSAAALMEEAGIGCASVIRQFYPKAGDAVLYLGTGNNAGDALVAARELQKDGWRIHARFSGDPAHLKELPARHWRSVANVPVLDSAKAIRKSRGRSLLLLDGLLGTGASGELRPALHALAAEMNALRHSHHAVTVAMDIPSGLDADTGSAAPGAVVADITAVIGYCKAGLIADAATQHVGRIALIPLTGLSGEGDEGAAILTPNLLRPWLPRRPFEMHKGQAGRVGVLAGSVGFLGAARLASEGALRGGAGLVTLLVKKDAYPLLAPMMPPEVMVRMVADYREILDLRFDALAIGPGLGFEADEEVLDVMCAATLPAVIDADALTMIGKAGAGTVKDMRGPRLLTPHPGEMRRLMANHPQLDQLSRREVVEAAAAAAPSHAVLFKGARTVIAQVGEQTLFNTVGHPGMATGGMGDVLTGVGAALLGQGIPLMHAAGVGAWLCGHAAEIAARDRAQETVLPTDVLRHVPRAWCELLRGCW